MFAHQIRQAAEAAPRHELPNVSKLLWSAYTAGSITEAEAEALSGLIEARQLTVHSTSLSQRPTGGIRKAVGSRPRTDASMERRRRWAAAGRLPPQIASQFTLAEQAVLAVVTAETVKRGDSRLAHEHLAALAGVSASTVKATLRRARILGLITIEERRVSACRNLPSVVRIIAREWLAWMHLARRATAPGGGAIFSPPTNTKTLDKGRQKPSERQQRAYGREKNRRARASMAAV